ncbi:DegT/DnrJ/EryC1/StrS family aminotransferase [Moheibacter lacus]|uniref:DegT/DnrJ/EryC1/StrS family aminotransferase n=1 Tax=Moheibacter lacus TaxID=2745851 RepID=A0A838ZTC3_9FLAO|nr:DegT/DnrJ/EryC1/StrS family aminotransferase [Moheibacter lacus]MBA5630240.1 DegT/DnrJ/EryC1/StrS family aminotransferase [Moheibacter lacus]
MPGFETIGKEEKDHVNEILETGILMRYNFDNQRNNHWKAKEWEEAIQDKIQIRHAHLTSSGTTALITAVKALGIGAGDEIILPTFTFVASVEALIFCNVIPVFADVDETLTLSPESVLKAISPRTKAIMPVHMCGGMADLDQLNQIAKANDLYLIEDACQSIGGKFQNQYLGTIGDVGCFSFDFVKTITSGEGGAVLTQDSSIYEYAHQFSDHGHDHLGNDRGAEKHPTLGLNFRISELQAAVGLAQWHKLDEILSQQRKIKSIIKNELLQFPEIQFRKYPDPSGDNGSFLSIFLTDETMTRKVVENLKSEGIPCAYWYDNHWHYIKKWDHFKHLKNDETYFAEFRDLLPDYENQDFSISDQIISRTITFPISLKINEITAKELGKKITEIIINQYNKK